MTKPKTTVDMQYEQRQLLLDRLAPAVQAVIEKRFDDLQRPTIIIADACGQYSSKIVKAVLGQQTLERILEKTRKHQDARFVILAVEWQRATSLVLLTSPTANGSLLQIEQVLKNGGMPYYLDFQPKYKRPAALIASAYQGNIYSVFDAAVPYVSPIQRAKREHFKFLTIVPESEIPFRSGVIK